MTHTAMEANMSHSLPFASWWTMKASDTTQLSSVQSNQSVRSDQTQLCRTLCDPMDCSTPDFPVHHQLLGMLKLMSIESVMRSNHLILCHPLLLLSSIFPSIRVISNESVHHIMCPKYWSLSFSISPSTGHPGLISFRMEWVDLVAVQRTLKSLLQYASSKASILLCSAFFIVQLSHPNMTTRKTIALSAK